MKTMLMLALGLALVGCAASTPAPQAASTSTSAAGAARGDVAGSAELATEKASTEGASTEATSTGADAAAGARFGAPIPPEMTLINVGTLVANPELYNGKTVAIEGVVSKMCKKKGCWFELTDGKGSQGVLLTAPAYNIFLSQGSEGKTVVAFGEFKREVQDLEEAKHFAQDAGEPVPTEAPVKLRLLAQGAQLR